MKAIVAGAIVAGIMLSVFASAASHAAADEARGAGGAAGAREEEARRLSGMFVGRWRPESGPEGKVQTVRADGTGTNVDDSAFLWHFEGRQLVARRAANPGDGEARISIRFTKDARAYRLTLEHGHRQVVFHRLGNDGQPLAHPDPASAEYEPVPPPTPPRAAGVPGPRVGRLVVKLDATDAPGLRPWGEAVVRKMPEWYPRIVAALAVERTEPELVIDLVLRGGNVPPGETQGTKIMISAEWIGKHPDAHSIVAHEMVHVLARYDSAVPAWLAEGIADYVRFYVIDRGSPDAEFRLDLADYENGYTPTAAMLDWLERQRPGVVLRLDAALREGTYVDGTFEQITGSKPEEAWKRFVESRR